MNTNSTTDSLPSSNELPPLAAQKLTEDITPTECTSAVSNDDAGPNPETTNPPATPRPMARNALVLGGC